MYYWNDLAEIPADIGPTVITIGNFDGVHLGHQHVLNRLVKVARAQDAAAVAISFDPHPAQVHRPGNAPELIMGTMDRVQALADTGLDGLLMMHYTLELASLTAEEFVRRVLVDALHAKTVVIGHDVRFGKGNAGDLDTMRGLGRELVFAVEAVDDFGALPDGPDSGRRCSSTWIREALREGDVRTAARLLGRSHRMRGEVVHGAARGRELGFPTANLAPEASGLIPADGIYAGWLVDEAGTRWPAAVSVGSNPTFEGVSRQVEAHVIDRPAEKVEDFDLYGQHVVVEFVDRLRGMVAYTGPEALVEQMRLDVGRTREVLSTESGTGR
ncbi:MULTISPECIES: bifunctional riboflavin kinase/FAD synthetase [unclassified Arthrobacter]|uniref:bifunctional riboflavin kinase/FAD synthetase n=1 Tax=unclassified Arthrobacter TaxID=235627 RepID=UPI0024DF460A|nr:MULTISPECIES: bifunctional riboflavin kinase/FAD synthetase [unclassified Arthrobacter]MCC9146271.1 bifunctional riboflavin kinase/FAD synthetase [Arthrobacter sp. zg-Y919]MDK1277501.1 bifunctional riboflavin kinase/FAD synthetase [Arthrobacter sp. zg.Y919]WIB03988.1 bifunctional riboflavin kinase/FAD synthetase [Arthrobacter sp. zg-Y919]